MVRRRVRLGLGFELFARSLFWCRVRVLGLRQAIEDQLIKVRSDGMCAVGGDRRKTIVLAEFKQPFSGGKVKHARTVKIHKQA